MKITAQHMEAVLALPAPKRYAYFIKKVADQRKAWGLYADGWALAGSDDGKTMFPLWPAREYAERCASGEWADHSAREIEVDTLLKDMLPGLAEEGIGLAIFYLPTSDKGIVPSMAQFESDLREELSKVE